MKKYLIIFLLLISPLCVSWMNVTTVGGGVPAAGGGAAANQTLDPNATISAATDWANQADETPSYADIDDGATPNDDDWIKSGGPDPQNYTVWGFPEVASGTINTVRVHIRMKCGSAISSDSKVQITGDGTNWTDASSNIGSVTTSYADYTKDFASLSWEGTTDLRVRLYSQYQFGEWCYFSRLRVEINP